MEIDREQQLRILSERDKSIKDRTVVLAYGRFQPFTFGHLTMMQDIVTLKNAGYNNYYIGTSSVNETEHKSVIKGQTLKNIEKSENKSKALVDHEKRKNPLTTDQKVKYIKLGMKSIGLDSRRVFVSSTPINAFKKMRGKGDILVIIGGTDRIPSYIRILNESISKPSDKKYFPDFQEYVAISQVRDNSSNPLQGISATLLRTLAVENNFEEFKEKIPYIAGDEVKQKKLFNQIRKAYKTMLGGPSGTHISFTGEIEENIPSISPPSSYSISTNAKSKKLK